jgi:tetratricopeptide (TPR) repeat protein
MDFLKIKPVLLITLILFNQSLIAQDFNTELKAFQESYLFEASGETQKAVAVLKKVYRENSYEINLRLGWLSYQSGLFTESLAYYNKAIQLRPLSIEAKFGYIYPASAMGNWDQVVNQYQKILKISPNNSVANHRLGLIFYGREEYDKAYILFEKVVNLYPFDHDALLMFAWTNLKMHKVREAKVLFQKALLNTPGGSSALEGLDETF